MEVLHFLIVFIYLLLPLQYALGFNCKDNPVGMQNNVIPDHKITASSGTAGDQARLSYTNGPSWCAMGKDTNPYLQIDLGTPHIICAVSTQGNPQAEEWVKTFQLNSSEDGTNYVNYCVYDAVRSQTFYGNVDGSGIVKHILHTGIFARYLHILPKMHHGAVCMRAELYGIPMQSENLALKKPAVQSSTIYKGFASRAVDGNRDNQWLRSSCTNCGHTTEQSEWWRVDLGTSVQVADISVFNRFDPTSGLRLWETLFEVRIGNSTSSPTANPRCGGTYGILPAGSITIVCNPAKTGRYVTLRQLKSYEQLSLCEVEVYGVNSTGKQNRQVCARQPIVVSNYTTLLDNSLSTSSIYSNTRSAAEARLHGSRSWRPRADDSKPWLQIDLVDIYYVCAVATQGDPNSNERTRTYKISWTLDGYSWTYVKLQTLQKNGRVFTGNRDPYSIIKHIFPSPLTTTMMRFYPVESNKAYALRVEIYGVVIMAEPHPLSIGNQTLQAKKGSYVDLVCRADGGLSITWYYNDTDITRYSNGTVRSSGILISKLRINYTSADDVYDKYSCGEVLLQQKRRCTSLEYICQVDYGFFKTNTAGNVTVELENVAKDPELVEENEKDKKDEGNKKKNTKGMEDRNKENSFSLTLTVILAVSIPVSLIVIIIIAVSIVWRRRIRRIETKQNYELTTMEEKGEQGQDEKDQPDLKTIVNSNYYPELVPVDRFTDFFNKARKGDTSLLAFEFQQLESEEEVQESPTTIGERPKNKLKNRYINIIPYDNSRVVLQKIEGEKDSDYINASYIRGFDGQTISYISCQGPVCRTIADFWRMIWQEKTSVIVMLTCLREDGKIKCQKYWPESKDTYLEVTVELRSTEVFADYLIRMFNVSKNNANAQRYVFQYHYTAWPDMSVPDPTSLLSFRNRIVSDTVFTFQPPWVVHCSAGVGRTGAFLAIDAMLRQAQEKKTIDVFSYVKAMRETRPYMVKIEEQYLFIYTVIQAYLADGVTEIRAKHLKKSMKKLAALDKKESVSGFEMEFKKLLSVYPADQEDSTTFGNEACNAKKNRFQYVLPLDKTRVILLVDENTEQKEGEDPSYINASYVKGYRQRDAYILTQAPLDNTVADFWKMIYDKRPGTIVMLNSLEEGNMIYPKYWPTKGSCQYGDITVEKVSEKFQRDIALRKFHLIHRTDEPEDNVHEVAHFQHLNWSDGSVPTNERTVLDLVTKISQCHTDKTPIVVQCSNGVGRSGTLCAIMFLLDRVKAEEMVDVFQTVKNIRKYRPGAVESLVQYVFCFKVVMAYLKSFSEYSNFVT